MTAPPVLVEPATASVKTGQRMSLSVLVPAKNEAATLTALVAQLHGALDPTYGRSWEVLVIDDGSTDGTWRVLTELSKAEPQLRAIRLRRNVGKAAALAVGIRECTGEMIATIDADLQDDPAELTRMAEQLDGEVDLVTGHKHQRKDPLTKRVPSRIFNTITRWVTGLKLRDQNCGLKLGRREVFEAIPLHGELHRYVPTLAHAMGYRVAELQVNHRKREHGRSNYGLERYVRGALDLLTVVTLTRYGRRPGHLFGGLGVLTGLVGTALLLYLAGVWVFTDNPIGTRPLLSFGVLLEVLSVQMISLGLLAEFILARTLQQEEVLRFVAERTTVERGAMK
jgi:glycosyltransferase involved in cell wall biosynthesis